MNYHLNSLGNSVKKLREHRRLTQEELADMAGITAETLSQIEDGVQPAGTLVLDRLAWALNGRLVLKIEDYK